MALLLTLAVHILIILMLLWLSPSPPPLLKPKSMPTIFSLPEPRARSDAKIKRDGGGAPRKPNTPQAAPASAPKPPVVPSKLLTLSSEEFAAADIGNLPSHRGDSGGSGKDSSAVYGPGEGPGGAQMFDADWYRRPTNAELSSYLPARGPPKGWGLIACQTVENYHVDNCRQLGESPLGSGLSRAARLAAWQFLVKPPRINGRPMIGAWVRIRIEYTQYQAEGPDLPRPISPDGE